MNDSNKIMRIAGRGNKIAKELGHSVPAIDLAISLSVCHSHTPLNLDELETFDDGSFGHDVFGIHRYLNQLTGELQDCFVPRCGFKE